MKKLLIILPVIVLIAAGCNSKKVTQNSPVVSGESVKSEQKNPVAENVSKDDKNSEAEKIAELQKQIDELKKQNKKTQSVPATPAPAPVVPVQSQTPPSPVFVPDLCTNIDGNQSSLPSGMIRKEDGSCTTKPPPKNDTITSSDIYQYKSGVVVVLCNTGRGSGTLWHLSSGDFVLTNRHVMEGANGNCLAIYRDESDTTKGIYYIDPMNAKIWNNIADEALLPIIGVDTEDWSNSIAVSDLNFSIGMMDRCRSMLPDGTNVVAIGFPSSGGYSRITSNGIVSGFRPQLSGLPEQDYFVSAQIDKGNSGGIALAKYEGSVCVLGIPTAVTTSGTFVNEGIVQNIENIIFH